MGGCWSGCGEECAGVLLAVCSLLASLSEKWSSYSGRAVNVRMKLFNGLFLRYPHTFGGVSSRGATGGFSKKPNTFSRPAHLRSSGMQSGSKSSTIPRLEQRQPMVSLSEATSVCVCVCDWRGGVMGEGNIFLFFFSSSWVHLLAASP